MQIIKTKFNELFARNPKVKISNVTFSGKAGMNQLIALYKSVDAILDGDGHFDLTECVIDFEMTPDDYRGTSDATIRKAIHDHINA